MEKQNFEIVESEIIFRGKVFEIQVDKIKYDSGNTAPREVVLHNGGAVVLAKTESGKIILIKQFRYPFKEELWELPAGKLEKGEDPLVCAGRELKEETGYSAKRITKLGSIFTSPGFCREELHIFYAEGLTEGNHAREEGEEGMTVHEFSPEEITQMIMKGEIKDSKTIAGMFYYLNRNDK